MEKTYISMNSDNDGKSNEIYTRFVEAYRLVEFLEDNFRKDVIVWCPFDKENSNIVLALQEKDYKVIFTHIDTGQDFLTFVPNFAFDIMISNPPFSKRTKFFNKINSYNKPYIMLQPIMFFNNNSMIKELVKDSCRYRFICPENRMGFITIKGKEYTEKDKTTSFYCFWLCKDIFLNKDTFITFEKK